MFFFSRLLFALRRFLYPLQQCTCNIANFGYLKNLRANFVFVKNIFKILKIPKNGSS